MALAFKVLGMALNEKITCDELMAVPIPVALRYSHLATSDRIFTPQEAIRRSNDRYRLDPSTSNILTLFLLPTTNNEKNIYQYKQSRFISKTPLEYYEVNCNVYPPTVMYGKSWAMFKAKPPYHFFSESFTLPVRLSQPNG